MGIIFDEIYKALGYLLIAGVVMFAWKTARDNAGGGKLKAALWKGFLWCAGVAVFASLTLGNPTCVGSEQDTRGTTCYEYADDGYEPTTEQRAAKFAYFMTLLYLPVVIGAARGAGYLKEA
jgi:hypothetical protein